MGNGRKRARSSQAAEAFLSQFERWTLKAYGQALREFESWCASHDVDPLDVKSWHFDLFVSEHGHLSATSLHQKQGVIVRFYNYLVERGELRTSPVPTGWRQPIPYRVNPEKTLPPSTLAAVETAASELGSHQVAVVRLIMEVGLLPEAMSKLSAADLSRDGPVTTLTIRHRHGTGLPTRRLSSELADALWELAARWPEGSLLRTQAGTPVDRRNIGRVLNRIAARAGVGRISATSLRQSAAAALAQSGMSPAQVEGLLGGRFRRLKDVQLGPTDVAPAAVALQLLELSKLLLDEPGAEAAASVILTAAGLEYYMKQLLTAAGLTPGPATTMTTTASALRSAGVISKQERKTIEPWAGLRNSAVHGDFTDVSHLEARHFNEGFEAFVQRHPL
jgi:site-specific recombinase XerC